MRGLRCLWKPHEGSRSPGAGVTVSLARVLETELGFFAGTVHTLTAELSLSGLLTYRGAIQRSEDIPGEPRHFFHLLAQGLNSGSVAKCLYLSVILRQSFIKFPRLSLNLLLESRLTLNFQSSCFSLPSSWGGRLAHRAPLGCS